MKHRELIEFFLILFVLLLFSCAGMSQQTQDLKIKVSIFQIPPFQTVVSNEPAPKAKDGVVEGIRGTMTEGNVTGFFPDGIVFLEIDGFQNNEELYSVIKEKVRFPDITTILPVGDIYFKLYAIEEDEEGYYVIKRYRITWKI